MSPTRRCHVKGRERAFCQLKPGEGASTGPVEDNEDHPSTWGALGTVENIGEHVAARESIQMGLACTPRVYTNRMWTTWESQAGSILKPAPKDAWEGVRPPRAGRNVEKHHKTRMRPAQKGRNDMVCIKGAAGGLPGGGIPKQLTRASMRKSQLRISARPGSGTHRAVQGRALLAPSPPLVLPGAPRVSKGSYRVQTEEQTKEEGHASALARGRPQ